MYFSSSLCLVTVGTGRPCCQRSMSVIVSLRDREPSLDELYNAHEKSSSSGRTRTFREVSVWLRWGQVRPFSIRLRWGKIDRSALGYGVKDRPYSIRLR